MDSLTSTKLLIPPPQRSLVSRLRLYEQLNLGLEKKLTLISAPAGYGKTMLLSAWASHSQIPLAWITLDEGENDLVRFFAYILGALEKFKPGLSESLKDLLQSPQLSPGRDFVSDLINVLNQVKETFVLVMDDYHLIGEQAVHDTINHLLIHLPPQMHLFIASRADPPLKLSRLRAHAEMNELRLTDLIFTRDESEQLLNGLMALGLDYSELSILIERTEGWIAGLQMAAISLRDVEDKTVFIQSFSSSNRFILDYLVEEVLKTQSEEIQSFLVKTSILNRLTGSLCDFVTGQNRSQEILITLEQSNLFIIPLDEERTWYRYHQLFRDLLLKKAQRDFPEEIGCWHQLASNWFESHELPDEGIEHALVSQDINRAADLIEAYAQITLTRSEFYTFLGWVNQLPDEITRHRSNLNLYIAYALAVTDAPVETVETWLDGVDINRKGMVGKVGVLRGFLCFMRGEVFQAYHLLQDSLSDLPAEDNLFQSVATWLLSLFSVATGDFLNASQELEKFVQSSIRKKQILFASGALCILAEIHLRLGQLPQAKEDYERALSVTQDNHRRAPITARALMGLGELWREWNDLELASQYCLDGIELAKHLRKVSAISGYITLARIKLAEGDKGGSYAAIQKAQQLALLTETTNLDDLMVDTFRAKINVMCGDLESARNWVKNRCLDGELDLATLDQKDDYYRYHILKYELLVVARWFIAMDQQKRALTMLDVLLVKMEEQGRIHFVIEILLLSSFAYLKLDEHKKALEYFDRCLNLATPGSYLRLFLDEGPIVIPLLQESLKNGKNIEFAEKLLAAFDAESIWRENGRKEAHSQKSAILQLPEPLTNRELELLSLIAEGLSNQEISRRLFISVPTVKWHTSNIFGKLGVRNRTQAVVQARSLGILPPS